MVVAEAAQACRDEQPLIIDDATGRTIDLDLRGSIEDIRGRLASPSTSPKAARGRPKLGVVAREITLLPRHWEWLAAQPGGTSAALRRLIDQARRETVDADAARRAQEATYRVMTTLAGDLPGYEEATRALFARDQARFDELTTQWPKDIAAYVAELSETVWPHSP
jgi:hypothetical protein